MSDKFEIIPSQDELDDAEFAAWWKLNVVDAGGDDKDGKPFFTTKGHAHIAYRAALQRERERLAAKGASHD